MILLTETSESVFKWFDKYFEAYSEKVDGDLIPASLPFREFIVILNDEFLKKLKTKLNIKIKFLKDFREDYYDELRKNIKTQKQIIQAAQTPQTPIQKQTKNQDPENEDEIDDYEKLITMAPLEEQTLFRDALNSYRDNPSFAKLNQLTKYLDRTKKMQNDNRHISKVSLIPYVRPDWLSIKQQKISDFAQSKKNGLVHGERQTGKDTAIAVGKFEQLLGHNMEHPLFFMASKIDTAREIITKILAEGRFQYVQPFICKITNDYITFYNEDGGVNRLQLIDTTESAVKGITGDLWVDDIDTIIKNHKQDVLTKAVAITRANTNITFIFTSNMGKGAYISLLEEWKDPKWKDFINVIELKRTDVTHINQEKDAFLWATMSALSGEAEANAQLYNTYNSEGDAFNPQTLKDAFNTYEFFMARIEPKTQYTKTILSIDPSGTGHPFGWCVLRISDNDFIWELDSGEFKMGDYDETGQCWTPSKIDSFLRKKYYDYKCTGVIFEGNNGGAAFVVTFRAAGMNAKLCNFAGEGKVNSHSEKIRTARWFFDNMQIVIANRQLKAELSVYNPVVSKRTGNGALKGDVADAFLHAIWELVGGVRFLRQKRAQEREMDSREAQNTEVVALS